MNIWDVEGGADCLKFITGAGMDTELFLDMRAKLLIDISRKQKNLQLSLMTEAIMCASRFADLKKKGILL